MNINVGQMRAKSKFVEVLVAIHATLSNYRETIS